MVKAFASVTFFLAMGAGWVADWIGPDRAAALAGMARDLFEPVRVFGPSCPVGPGFSGAAIAI